jgi:hypothetical protein
VFSVVSLGTQNQGTLTQDTFNAYQWPLEDGDVGQQLTTDGAGNLSWEVPSTPSLQIITLLEPFDGARQSFTMLKFGTNIPFIPVPTSNLIVFLGGVPQIPVAAYTVPDGSSSLNFVEAPLTGSTFYAISNIIV